MDEIQTPVISKPPLLGFYDLFSQAWELYVSRVGVFIGVLILPLLISLFGSFATSYGMEFVITSVYSLMAKSIVLVVVVAAVLLLFVMFIHLWSQTAFLSALVGANENLSTRESYRRGLKIMLAYLWITILVGFMAIGGTVLLIVPGILVGLWSMFALIILADSGEKGLSSILKSRELVRGYMGGIFLRMLGFGVGYLVVTLILNYVLGTVPYGIYVATVVNNLVLAPLISVVLYVQYRNLKTIKGETTSVPDPKSRKMFIAFGILGVIVVVTAIVLGIIFSSKHEASAPAPVFDDSQVIIDETTSY